MSFDLRIGSRPSALAMAQAKLIQGAIARSSGGITAEIVPISTSGDKMQSAWLAQVGGKGLFVRELEQALSEGRIDLAVHSMKDLPAMLSPDYRLIAVPPRYAPHDALITAHGEGWPAVPKGGRLGTSSNRRRFEALRVRPDLQLLPLRGNVDTRLKRLGAGDFDAIVLAVAGLRRLGIEVGGSGANQSASGLSVTELDPSEFVPSGGQGALAVEALDHELIAGSREIEELIVALNHLPTEAEVTAERAFLSTIGASCVSPVGVHAIFKDNGLAMRALLFSLDGSRSITGEMVEESKPDSRRSRAEVERIAASVGEKLGQQMLDRGAGELIGRE
jgi:hydroxymethylbilane synthase